MKKIALLLLFAVVFHGCSRSKAYKQEQSYYREDSEYQSRKGNATSRAEKFGQPKKRLYVFSFMNDTPLGGDELGTFAAQEMLREIHSSGRAIVPEDVRTASVSKDFYSGDKVRLGALLRDGKQLGLALVVIGKIKKITYRQKGDEIGILRQKKSVAAVDLEMRMFDISEGKEVLLDEKSADSTSSQLNLFDDEDPNIVQQRLELVRQAIRNGMRMLTADTARALEKIHWEGRIAKISGNRIFINAGRASGLNIGDILKVMTVGEDVYDPATGGYMGRSPGQAKGTLEIVDYLGPDGAVTTVHSGGGFFENDVVQLY